MQNLLLAYLGPDTLLPVASVFAAIVGGVMMLGRNTLRIVLGSLRLLSPRRRRPVPGPHHPPSMTGANTQESVDSR